MELLGQVYYEDEPIPSSGIVKEAESVLRLANSSFIKRMAVELLKSFMEAGCAQAGLTKSDAPPRE